MVRIITTDAQKKVQEQITTTKILDADPTPTLLRQVQRTLSRLRKKGHFSRKLYKVIYQSDAVPPRMYGTVKTHKPQKDYPARLKVSTIGISVYQLMVY